jgi:hypothetical protein
MYENALVTIRVRTWHDELGQPHNTMSCSGMDETRFADVFRAKPPRLVPASYIIGAYLAASVV